MFYKNVRQISKVDISFRVHFGDKLETFCLFYIKLVIWNYHSINYVVINVGKSIFVEFSRSRAITHLFASPLDSNHVAKSWSFAGVIR